MRLANNAYWLLFSLLIIICDQLSKYAVNHALQLNEPVVITSFFNFTLKHNLGAAFNFLSSAGGWQRWFLSGIAIVIIVFIVVWMQRLLRSQKWLACALALILAGAVSNLYDRIALGFVIDFLHLHIKQWSWPIFNIADTAICLGAFMLALDVLVPAAAASKRPLS